MKILIIADTHGSDHRFARVREAVGSYDLLLHAGDLEGSEDYYRAHAGTPFFCVAGNNDLFSPAPSERLLDLEGLRLFLTHGHRQHLYRGTEELCREAHLRGAQIVVFGHTHRPLAEHQDGLLLLNPGSLTYPRQKPRRPSYATLTLRDGRIEGCEICYLS